MRVLIVGGYAPSLLNFRGPLLARLASLGHEVLAAAPDADSEIIEGLARLGVEYRSYPLARAGLNPLRDLQTFRALKLILKDFRPDVVVAYTAKPVIYTGLACQGSSVSSRFFALITGLGYGFGQSGRRQQLIGRLVRRLYRRALTDASGVVFQNPDDQSVFRREGLLGERTPDTVVNGSGVDLSHY
ncbi:MAG: glycosyltransferase, partial [Pseudomonadota bacterium]